MYIYVYIFIFIRVWHNGALRFPSGIFMFIHSGIQACYMCLWSGWGSDGNVYNVLRSLGGF